MELLMEAPAKRQQFCDRLRIWRNHFSITSPHVATRDEFAKFLAVEPSFYAQLETGVSEPRLSFLQLLRERTGVSLDWLIDGD